MTCFYLYVIIYEINTISNIYVASYSCVRKIDLYGGTSHHSRFYKKTVNKSHQAQEKNYVCCYTGHSCSYIICMFLVIFTELYRIKEEQERRREREREREKGNLFKDNLCFGSFLAYFISSLSALSETLKQNNNK